MEGEFEEGEGGESGVDHIMDSSWFFRVMLWVGRDVRKREREIVGMSVIFSGMALMREGKTYRT